MRCALWLTFSLIGSLLLAGNAVAAKPSGANGKQTAASKDDQMKQRLQRKWIVRTVQHGDKPTGAQIGQQPGDIIEVALTETGLFLS